MESGWEPSAGRLVEGGRWVLDAGGKGPVEGLLLLTASERGARQMDMEAEPGSSVEALLSDASYAVAAAAAVVVEPAAAVDQTACLGGGWVPTGGRRWIEGQPWLLAGATAGDRQRMPAAGPPGPPG